MKIGIMQPYFFPYIGYFQLINLVDRFVLFDDVQYIRHGWINRNRILKPVEGEQYIILPLAEHKRDTLIKDIKAVGGHDWKTKILRQIEHYKKKAPYYPKILELLTDCFDTTETNVTLLNGYFIKKIFGYLDLSAELCVSSAMNFDYSHVNDAGEWALRISEQCGASEYINPPGGIDLFDADKFRQSNVKLKFIHPELKAYNQRRNTFEPGLSIIDVLMFNDVAETRAMLNNYTLS